MGFSCRDRASLNNFKHVTPGKLEHFMEYCLGTGKWDLCAAAFY